MAPRTASARAVALVLTAARGPSWLELRLGSESGPVRYLGTLEQGGSVRVRGRRLWIRAGVANNLEVVLDGRPVEDLPQGVATMVATSKNLQTIELG